MASAVRKSPGGVTFAVRLTPKGGRDAIEGWQKDSVGNLMLKARVSSVPEDGKANAALIRLIADTLGLAKNKVSIASGAASRMKIIEVTGDAAEIARRLDEFGTVT